MVNLNTFILSLVTIVGLFVLMAMGKISWIEAGTPILMLATAHVAGALSASAPVNNGVHIGSTTTTTTPTASQVAQELLKEKPDDQT